MKHTFKKEEKLSSKKHIQELFSKGSSFYSHPFVVRYLPANSTIQQNHALLVSVSKRKFKLAVNRNLLKRRIREAYRLNKQEVGILLDKGIVLNVALVYSAKKELPFDLIENKLILVLQRLVEEVQKD